MDGLPPPPSMIPPASFSALMRLLLLTIITMLVLQPAASRGLVSHPPPRNVNGSLNAFGNFQCDLIYQQTLDHFNYQRETYGITFRQRYCMDISSWGGRGTDSPMLVYTGAEEKLEKEVPVLGFHRRASPALRAMVIYIEHRYYGGSAPFESSHQDYKDGSKLGWLTVSQALADYAEIVLFIQKKYDVRGPVIAIGCSYGGMLSAYFRLKYPHIVLGALSSSAPVNYVNGDVSTRSDYYKTVSSVFRDTSITCFRAITLSWGKIDEVFRREGAEGLMRVIPPCSAFGTVDTLYDYLMYHYGTFAMYDRAGRSSHLKRFCKAVSNTPKGTTILEKIRAGLDAVFDHPNCFEISSDLDEGHPAPTPELNAWDWQMCTEIVLPLGSKEGRDSMFKNRPFNIQSHINNCQRRFHVKPRIEWMATTYNITPEALSNFGSNIIFSNGRKDPYSNGGVLQNISSSIVAMTTEEGSHCEDVINPEPETDPKWLDDMRAQELKVIESWFK